MPYYSTGADADAGDEMKLNGVWGVVVAAAVVDVAAFVGVVENDDGVVGLYL